MLRNNCLKWSVQRRRRSATSGFIVEASFVLQEIVGVLSYPEQGAANLASGTALIRVACAAWRSRRKAYPAAGGRAATNFATGDRQQTCEQEVRYQKLQTG